MQCADRVDDLLRRRGLWNLSECRRDVLRLLKFRSWECVGMLRLRILWRQELLRVIVDCRTDSSDAEPHCAAEPCTHDGAADESAHHACAHQPAEPGVYIAAESAPDIPADTLA